MAEQTPPEERADSEHLADALLTDELRDALARRAQLHEQHQSSHRVHTALRRGADRASLLVYPIRLENPLPEVAVLLLPGDPAVPLDLQAVFTRCYDTGPYRRLRPYGDRTHEPPLTSTQAEWANRLLREQGPLGPASGG